MKKALLALAVFGAFAGAASAQTNVTIYGVADIGLSRTDTNATEPVWGLTSGQQNGSRIGFRGTEDLGGGLSAIFTLENGYNMDTGTLGQGNRLFGRQAFVGLSSTSLGTIKLGRQYSLNHDALVLLDPFVTNLAVNTENAAPGYFGGLTGALQYGFGEQTTAFTNGRQIAASLTYANGPLTALGTYLTARSTTGAVDQKSYLLGGTYNFGVAKAHVAFQDNTLETGAAEAESRTLMLGATVPVGPGNALASWIRADDKNSDAKSDQIALGYTHPLSKRTNLYTSAAWQKTEAPAAADVKATIFNAGIRHLF